MSSWSRVGLILIGLMAGCSGSAPALPDVDSGAAPEPFLACQIMGTDDAGYATYRNVTCSSTGVVELRWGWTGDGFTGSCSQVDAGCVFGSPCTVATATSYEQGGCL